MRRAHDGLTAATPIRCTRCKSPIERHTICRECGYYRGKPVVAVEEGI